MPNRFRTCEKARCAAIICHCKRHCISTSHKLSAFCASSGSLALERLLAVAGCDGNYLAKVPTPLTRLDEVFGMGLNMLDAAVEEEILQESIAS